MKTRKSSCKIVPAPIVQYDEYHKGYWVVLADGVRRFVVSDRLTSRKTVRGTLLEEVARSSR